MYYHLFLNKSFIEDIVSLYGYVIFTIIINFYNIKGRVLELYNLDIERGILSAILFDGKIYEDVAAILKPTDFYHPFHQEIFKAMEELYKKDYPIDEIFLKENLTKKNKFNEAEFLEILGTAPVEAVEAYARELKDLSLKRELIHLSNEIKKIVLEEDKKAIEEVEDIQGKLFSIATSNLAGDFKSSDLIVNATLEYIKLQASKQNKIVTGLDTGFVELNRMTSGFGEGDLIILAARPSMGKCLGKGTKVMMYDGSLKKVEDIKIGDLLMGDDSTPRKVLSVTRGREMMYWIRQNKGIDYRVNESHILSLKRSRNENNKQHGEVLNISVKDFLQKSEKFRNNFKGYKVGVEFEEKEISIEPYFLGIWLGDGRNDDVRIAVNDDEIVNYLKDYAKRLGHNLNIYEYKDKVKIYSITNNGKNSIQAELRKLNLLNNKHIPFNYLTNTEKIRLELLAGLIDSDGYYDKSNGGYEITIKEERLAKDIKYLCDTLGFRTSLKEKHVAYNDELRKYYRVRFFGNVDKIPVKVERKKAKEWTCIRDFQMTGITIEKDKVDDYYGFEIDGNRLFLLEDGTVTHNTALALNIALNVLKNDKGVAIFSLEMPAEQLMLRMLSAAGKLPLQDLRRGNLTDEEWSKLTAVIDEISEKPLFVDDEGNINIHTIRAKLRKLKMQNPDLSLVIIDYLQLINSDIKERHLAISEISRSLKLLARELQIPIVALSQLNRALESRPNKRPMLSDLRESGAIEQDADIIMFIYRDDVYKAMEAKQKQKEALEKGKAVEIDFKEKEVEEAEIIIGKQRNGPTGTIEMLFHKKYTLFTDKVSEVQEIQMNEAQIEIPNI